MHHDEPVALLPELDRGVVGLTHATFAFVRERHRGEGEHRRAGLGREAGDHRCGAAAGAAAEAGDKHHERHAGEQATEGGFFGLRGSEPQRGFAARPHAAGLRASER